MGKTISKMQATWLKVRPKSMDPMYVQMNKVLKKFDRVRPLLYWRGAAS
jgi:hypothetical protein